MEKHVSKKKGKIINLFYDISEHYRVANQNINIGTNK